MLRVLCLVSLCFFSMGLRADKSQNERNLAKELSEASGYGKPKIALARVKQLVEIGADVNATYDSNPMYKEEMTPLHSAASMKNEAVVYYLLENGANPHALDSRGNNVYYYLLEMGLNFEETPELIKLIKHFIKLGVNTNVIFTEQRTPFSTAVSFGMFEAAKLFFENNGARNLNLQDVFGRTPLHKAALHGNAEMVDWLLSKGAQAFRISNAGFTPLRLAIVKRHTKVVELLVNYTSLKYCREISLSKEEEHLLRRLEKTKKDRKGNELLEYCLKRLGIKLE